MTYGALRRSNLRLFDTPCPFETCDASVIGAILSRARSAGVERLLAVGGSEKLNQSAATAHALGASFAIGYDRDQVGKAIKQVAEDVPLSAWGEIGLDYHYSPETRDGQIKLFESQLEEARKRDLPIIVHTREADDDTLAILRDANCRGIIHSFTGSLPFAKKLLDLGYYISYSGIVTFKAADNVRESAVYVPDDRILIETDSPFLAPVPKRGQENEPAFIAHTCEFLAKLRGTSADEFAERTYNNAERLLGKK